MKTNLLGLLPIMLMCAVAANQMVRCNFGHLSPWKGGGFGMFSTTDAPNSRMIFIYLEGEGQRYPTSCPKELRFDYYKLRTLPTPNRMLSFAERLHQFTWIDYGTIAGYAVHPEDGDSLNDSRGDDDWSRALDPDGQAKQTIKSVEFVGVQSERYSHLPNQTPIAVRGVTVEVWRPLRKLNSWTWERIERVTYSKSPSATQ